MAVGSGRVTNSAVRLVDRVDSVFHTVRLRLRLRQIRHDSALSQQLADAADAADAAEHGDPRELWSESELDAFLTKLDSGSLVHDPSGNGVWGGLSPDDRRRVRAGRAA